MIGLLLEPWRERLLAALGLAGALLLLTVGRGAPRRETGPVRFEISALPKDADELGCASDVVLFGKRCAFDAHGAAVQGSKPLRPFVSTDGELLLLSGVFEAPEVRRWLERTRDENPTRVILRCNGTLAGHAARVGVRFESARAFTAELELPVVLIERCSVRK